MFSGANFNCSGCAYWEVGQVGFHSHVGIPSFPGPAQLFFACIMEKREEPSIFSHMGTM